MSPRGSYLAGGPPLCFAKVLGTRVRLELGEVTAVATITVDVVALDAVGVYGCVEGLPLVEFWPWHRIRQASACKRQGELIEDRGSAAGAAA